MDDRYRVEVNAGKVWSNHYKRYLTEQVWTNKRRKSNKAVMVKVYGKYVRLCRVVATKKFGRIPEGVQVNHIDGDVTNNCGSNLELVTPSQNMLHAYNNGLSKPKKGEMNGQCKLSDSEVAGVMKLKGLKSAASVAKELGVSATTIERIMYKGNRNG